MARTAGRLLGLDLDREAHHTHTHMLQSQNVPQANPEGHLTVLPYMMESL